MVNDDGFRPSEEGLEPLLQIVERVAVLAEDDQLSSVAVGVEHLGSVLEVSASSSHLRSTPEDNTRPA
jgi:hypothetical protein